MVDDWTKWRDDCGRIQTFEGVQEKQIRNYSLVNKHSNETNPPLADALSAQSGDFLCLFHSECCGQSFPQLGANRTEVIVAFPWVSPVHRQRGLHIHRVHRMAGCRTHAR